MMWVYIILWIICGILNYGLSMAYLQNHYKQKNQIDYHKDVIFAMMTSMFGIYMLIVTISNTWIRTGNPFKYGLQYKYNSNQFHNIFKFK